MIFKEVKEKSTITNEKLHPQGDGVFGHREWGMGHGEEVTNALCPVPQAAGRLSLSTHKGMEFPAAFNETYRRATRSIFFTYLPTKFNAKGK